MIITICGSYKFKEQMMSVYRILTNKKHIVLLPAIDCFALTKEEYLELHFKKIEMSDAIFVVDGVEVYTGMSTRKEMQHAFANGVRIYRYSRGDLSLL